MKNMAKKGKMAGKKGGFGGEKGENGGGKTRVDNQTRKAKWCKMQVLCLKIDKQEDVKG